MLYKDQFVPEWCGDRDKDAERPPCNVGDDRSDARSALKQLFMQQQL